MPKRVPTTLNEKVSPAERLAREQQAGESMRLARKLLRNRNYKGAFLQFKLALAKTEDSDVFPSSFDMAELAKNYRPALVALKKWRSQKEKLIFAQAADASLISQWDRLNKCLGDKDRILVVFMKLKSAGADEKLLRCFYWKIWKTLVKKKQYQELRQFLSTLGWMTLASISEHHAEKWFPEGGLGMDLTNHIIKDGVLVYEIAIALQAFDAANVIVEKLLSVEDTDSTYAALITAARRARAIEQARALYNAARQRLGTHRVRKSKKALGRLVSSKLIL